jgi:hypothetical protein
MLGFKPRSQTESDICRLVVTIICSLTPDAPNGDKCMPSLLVEYSIKLKAGTTQPDENYERGGSCTFDAARIESYEKANRSFKTDMLHSGGDSLPKLRDLLVMDLAYIHLRTCKWKAKTPSHLGNGTADDDGANNVDAALKDAPPASDEADERNLVIPLRDDYEFMKWDLTQPEDIPWTELTFTYAKKTGSRGDLPHYFLPAMCIAMHAIISGGSKVSG